MKASENKLQRRTFMTAAVCVPALAVAAVIARRPPVEALPAPEAAPQPAAEPVAQGGYHETEHIRHYYATAAF